MRRIGDARRDEDRCGPVGDALVTHAEGVVVVQRLQQLAVRQLGARCSQAVLEDAADILLLRAVPRELETWRRYHPLAVGVDAVDLLDYHHLSITHGIRFCVIDLHATTDLDDLRGDDAGGYRRFEDLW